MIMRQCIIKTGAGLAQSGTSRIVRQSTLSPKERERVERRSTDALPRLAHQERGQVRNGKLRPIGEIVADLIAGMRPGDPPWRS